MQAISSSVSMRWQNCVEWSSFCCSTLSHFVCRREKSKKEILQLTIEVLEKRFDRLYVCGGVVCAGVCMNIGHHLCNWYVCEMSMSKASFLFTFYFGMKLCRVHVGSLSVQVQKLGVLVLWDLFKFRKRGGRKVQLVAVETRKPIGRTLMCSTPTPFICTGKQLANALLFAAQNMLTVVATGTRLRV